MRNVAIGLLVIVLGSIITQALIEVVNVGREKIIIGTAISNSARAAKDRSLKYEYQRDLHAVVDEGTFVEYFADAFENSLNLTLSNPDQGNHNLIFKSNDGKYHDIVITLDFLEEDDSATEQMVSKVTMEAESQYKFKTKPMQFAEDAGKDVDYKIVEKRTLILSIKN